MAPGGALAGEDGRWVSDSAGWSDNADGINFYASVEDAPTFLDSSLRYASFRMTKTIK